MSHTRTHLRRAVHHTQQTLLGFGVELLWIARVQGYLLRGCVAALVQRLSRLHHQTSAHDLHWQAHPAVATGDDLTFGQRMADWLKALVATWTALFLVLAAIMWWLYAGGFPPGSDSPGFLHLNLALSCFAALQCFILLIAAKRADQIAAAIALHTLQNTERLAGLIEANTALTEQVATLTREVHARVAPSSAAQVHADQSDGPSSSS